MNKLQEIIAVMHPDCWYSAADIAGRVHITEEYARQCLRMLRGGDLIETRPDEACRRRKQYSSKQLCLVAANGDEK